MSDTKISAMSAATAATASTVPVVQGGVNKKVAMTGAGAAMIEAANASAQLTLLGVGTMGLQAASSVAITGGTAAGLTGLGLRSTGAAFDLTLASAEALTAGRTLTFNVVDADRTLTVPATGTAALLGRAQSFTAINTFAPTTPGSAMVITSGTVTTSLPFLTATQTWNAGGVTFVGMDHTFTKTAAATGSLMARWSTASRGNVAFDEAGEILIGSGGTVGFRTGNSGVAGTNGGALHVGCTNGYVYLGNTGNFGGSCIIIDTKLAVRSDMSIGFSADTTSYGTFDTFFRRKAAATIQMGVDAAGVTNQMFTAASRITSDGIGADLSIAAGNGRGAAGGALIFKYYTTAGAATIGTLTEAMRITTTGAIILAALPTSDPGVSGQLYKSAGVVMQSP